ncbi:MAG TPA: trypsin-like serine protease [Polyangia bacterium]|nr:trypsin-like serine protease [Polyangia bacterium]
MRHYRWLVSVVLVCGGCGASPEEQPGWQPVMVRAESQPALGYLDVSGSLIVPWCAAVLISPKLVVTAAHCVGDFAPSHVTFGVGRITPDGAEGGSYRVRDIVLHPDRALWQHNLAALILEEPVRGVWPVRLGEGGVPDGRLTSVTYEFVVRGHAGERRVWAGQAQGKNDPITLVPTEGQPNCHADAGTGAIDAGGNVLGFLSAGAQEKDPDHNRGGVYDGVPGCYQSYKLAAVAQNLPFIDHAMSLAGRPIVVP